MNRQLAVIQSAFNPAEMGSGRASRYIRLAKAWLRSNLTSYDRRILNSVWKMDHLRRSMMSFVLIFTLQCLFPIFDFDAEFTGVSIVNPDTQGQTFAVTVMSSDGSGGNAALVSLRPGAQRVALLKEIVPTTPTSPGYIRISPSLNSSLPTCTSYVTSGTTQALTGMDGAPAPPPLPIPPPPTLPPPTPTTLILPHGRGVSCARHQAQAGSRYQDSAR